MSMRNFLHYLLLITHPTVVFLVAALTLGFLLATYAGLAGIVLALLLLMWLSNYAYVLLEHIANGAREPPVLAIEMLNPLNEQRPPLQLAIVLLVCAALSWLAHYLSTALAIALAVLAFIALPASIAALGVGTSFLQAINPMALWHIVRSLRMVYAAIVVLVLGYGLGLSLLASRSLLPFPLHGYHLWRGARRQPVRRLADHRARTGAAELRLRVLRLAVGTPGRARQPAAGLAPGAGLHHACAGSRQRARHAAGAALPGRRSTVPAALRRCWSTSSSTFPATWRLPRPRPWPNSSGAADLICRRCRLHPAGRTPAPRPLARRAAPACRCR
jgi:hypothetical protein